MTSAINTLKDYCDYADTQEIEGGFMTSKDEERLISAIRQAISEHEAKLKAKDKQYNELNKEYGNALIMLNEKFAELISKDGRITELKECCEIYKENIKSLKEAHDEIVKAKNEEIEMLKEVVKTYSNGIEGILKGKS